MSISDMYTLIDGQLGDSSNYGRSAAYSTIYMIVIIILIVIAFLLIMPREKKSKEKIMKTQHDQLRITLKKMEEDEKNGKTNKRNERKAFFSKRKVR
jgi:flagellar biosynthesis/type III secretory pathway M-ring protein FliF/YscJ